MDSAQEDLIERVRALLEREESSREVSMFGGRSFLVNEKMVACARRAGNLLVRVDAARHNELLRRPGAGAAQMGPARTMGAGWIEVARGAIDDDESLSAWVAVAMEFNRAATGHRP